MTRLMDRRAQDHRIPALDLPGFCPAVCPALAGLPLSDQHRNIVPTGTLEAHSLRVLAIRVPPARMRREFARAPSKCLETPRFPMFFMARSIVISRGAHGGAHPPAHSHGATGIETALYLLGVQMRNIVDMHRLGTSEQACSLPCRHSGESRNPVVTKTFLDASFRWHDND